MGTTAAADKAVAVHMMGTTTAAADKAVDVMMGTTAALAATAITSTTVQKRPWESMMMSADNKAADVDREKSMISRQLLMRVRGGQESSLSQQQQQESTQGRMQQLQAAEQLPCTTTTTTTTSTTTTHRASSSISPLGWFNQMQSLLQQEDGNKKKKKKKEEEDTSMAPAGMMIMAHVQDAASETTTSGSHTLVHHEAERGTVVPAEKIAADPAEAAAAVEEEEEEENTGPLSVVIPDCNTQDQPLQLLPANDEGASSTSAAAAAAAVAAAAAGFGSPLPLFGSAVAPALINATTTSSCGQLQKLNAASEAAAMENNNSQQQQQQPPRPGAAAHHLVSGHGVPSGAVQVLPRPTTAQLTIFYAGMVHAYDNVPWDKMQAIMLLAGNRNMISSSCTNLPGSGGAVAAVAPSRPISAPITIPQSRTPSSSVPSTAQIATTTTAAGPSSSSPSPVITRPIARNVHPVTELPQARKASLARFLEKRKDRVRTKAPYPITFPIKKEGSSTTPRCNKSPSPPLYRQPRTRSPSPAAFQMVGSSSHQSCVPMSSTYSRDPQCNNYYKSIGGGGTSSEPNSPTRSPPTPPRMSMMAVGYINTLIAPGCSSSGVTDFERRQLLVNSPMAACQSEKSSPLRKASQDEKARDQEAMEEGRDGTS